MGHAGRTVHEPEEEAENPETGKGDRLVKTFPELVKTAGPGGAVMAMYVAAQTIRSDDGWVEKSIREMEGETGLGRYEQGSAIASLVKLGCLAVEASNGSKRRMKFVGEPGFLNDIVALCGAAQGITEGQHGNPRGNANHAGNQQGSSGDHAGNQHGMSAYPAENQHGLSTDRAGNQQGLSTGQAYHAGNQQGPDDHHAGKQQGGADYHAENQHGGTENLAGNQHGSAFQKIALGGGDIGGEDNTLTSTCSCIHSRESQEGEKERNVWEWERIEGGCGGKEGKGKVVVHGFTGGAIEVPPDFFRDAAKTTVQGDLLEPETGAISDTDQQPAQDQKKPQKPKNGTASQESQAPKTRYFATAKKPDDVDQAVWDDFIALRRAKKAPLTETALRMLENEAKKAGITTQEAMRMCCANGWQGFKASWMHEQKMRETALQERGDRAKGNGKDEDWWSRVL
jgi:hypothetical protein